MSGHYISESNKSKYHNELIIEIISEKLRIDTLTKAMPGPDIYPPYLLISIGLFIEYGILDIYNYFVINKSSFVTEPNTLIAPAAAALAVVGLRYINNGYADAMNRIGIDEDYVKIDTKLESKFREPISLRIRVVVYLLILISWHLSTAFSTGFYADLVTVEGLPTVLYGQIVSYSLIIIPVLAELALFYIAIHVLVPRHLTQADLDLFFYDPRNLGGFAPVGNLLKRSYYIYTGALLLIFVQAYLPLLLNEYLITPYPPPGPLVPIAFSAAWVIGVASIFYSLGKVHGIMKRKKEKKIQEIERKIKDAIENPHDVYSENIINQQKYDDAQKALTQVKSTNTYPTTFTMWSQIFVSVLLPQALNMAVQAI